jgi:hypothetical protein
MVVDARAENEGNNWAGSGANPWHLDQNTDSVLFLTNESDKPCPIGFAVTAGGIRYYLIKLKLNPHETRAIDMRTLRDAQQADFKGNKIPASAADGGVDWIRLDNLPIMGRMMVIRKGQGMAASYDCYDCCCAADLYSMGITPDAFDLLIDGSFQLEGLGGYEDCDDNETFYELLGTAADWASSNTGVVRMASTAGEAQGVSTGTATIEFTYYAPVWVCRANSCVEETYAPKVGYATGNVDSLVFTITSGGVPGHAQGVVARQGFNLRIQAESPSGVVPDTTFDQSGAPFTLANENTSVGESAPASVSFSSGTANAGVTIVQASGLEDSEREITVGADTSNTVFYPYAYMNVTATDEGLVNSITACDYKIPANAQFVALPYGTALCGQQVLVVNGSSEQEAPVEDVGPWCPHSVATSGNPCVCPADNYWQGTAVPYAATHSCSSNGAGIDLGDGTYSAVRHGSNGPVDWKFE